MALISFSIYSSFLRLSFMFTSVSDSVFVLSTVFFSIFYFSLYCLQLINIYSNVG